MKIHNSFYVRMHSKVVLTNRIWNTAQVCDPKAIKFGEKVNSQLYGGIVLYFKDPFALGSTGITFFSTVHLKLHCGYK